MKRFVCLFLMFLLFAAPVGAAEEEVVVTEFPVGATLNPIRLNFYGSPGTSISYEVIGPGKGLPADNMRESVLNAFGLLGQATCDASGAASAIYYPDKGVGIYRVRANGAARIRCVLEKALPEYYSLAWSDGSGGYDEDVIYPMYELTHAVLGAGKDPKAAAQTAAEALAGMPEGRRGIRLGSLYNMKLAFPIELRQALNAANSSLTQANAALEAAVTEAEKAAAQRRVEECTAARDQAQEDVLSYDNYGWWDKGGRIVEEELREFFTELAATGATVDYFICDFEETLSTWTLGHSNTKYLARYEAIERDERYLTDIRPLLEERGFVFCEDEDKNELYYVCRYTDRTITEKEKNNYLIFNEVMDNRKAAYMDQYVFKPYLDAYPAGICTNYSASEIGGAKMLSLSNHAVYKGGNANRSGTHSSPSLYGRMYPLAQAGYEGEKMEVNGFTALVYNQNILRGVDDFEEGRKTMPWVARENWISDGYYFGGTPWYYENILHSGLLNPEAFLFWGPRYYASDDPDMVEEQAGLFADSLRELELMAGSGDRRTLETGLSSWNRHFLLTGMAADGGRVYRITPDVEGTDTTVKSFCIDRETPTFQIAGTTITFPGYSIVTVSGSPAIYGYWVIGPEEAEPVISCDESALTGESFHAVRVFRPESGIMMDKLNGAKELTIRWDYHNKTANRQEIRLVAAGYRNGRLTFAKPLRTGTIESGAEGYELIKLALIGNETEVRIFLWDSNMRPLLTAMKLPQ